MLLVNKGTVMKFLILCGFIIIIYSGLNTRSYTQIQRSYTQSEQIIQRVYLRAQLHYFGCIQDGCKAHQPRHYNVYYYKSRSGFHSGR